MRAGVSRINPNPFTTRPEIEGTFGVVTSTHWIATAVGMATLEKGGNAFDAAVATAFVLQVLEPHLNGPGGDVPVILNDVKRGKPEVICGQGPAPAAATIAHFHGLGLDIVPGTGLLAACVPGMFDTWMLLLRDYGTMHVADVLAPAISYAHNGYPFLERASATIAMVEELFRDHWPTSAAVYLPGGNVPAPGSMFTNRTLAETYARVLREAQRAGSDRVAQIERARKTWSQGFVAEAIDKFCRTQEVMDVTGERHRGVLTGADMARWQAHVEAPLTYDYGRHTVCKAGVWSQGPVTLQQLALLKGYALDDLDPVGPDFIHLQVECAKLAFADREAFYGDPDFVEVPIETLLSERYNAERRKLITDKASLELRPGAVEGFGGAVKMRREQGPRGGGGRPGAGARTTATPSISTSSIKPAIWCRRRRRAAGCNRLRSFPNWVSASARGRRCSGSTRNIRRRWCRANGRAPRCRRLWPCATASPIWSGVRRAAISRTNGSRNSCCATCTPT
jgi:gamma-glutamyltranspeptidase/glutathione hydrolase